MVQSYYFFLNWTRNTAIKLFFVKQSFPYAFLNDNFRSILMCLMCCIPLLCPFLVRNEILILILVEDIRFSSSFKNNCYNNTFGVLILVLVEDGL